MIQVLSKMGGVLQFCVFLLLVHLHSSEAHVYRRLLSPYNPKIHNALPRKYSYKTLYMTQNVDHFGFNNGQTFQQRYLVANQFWNDNGGPIFFYTGNEGDITWFCNNTGFMWDIAAEFKALLVFAEHRYYGNSLPYGAESYANASTLNYLTSEQALADFAGLIRFMKQTVPGAGNSPVIVFGGSYGGMLSAWMRLKYPNLVLGALAASAPVWMFQGLAPCDSFFNIVERTFRTGSEACIDNIGASWSTLTKIGSSPGGLGFISEMFSICTPLKSQDDLKAMVNWLNNIYGDLAMVDYPYPASFLEPLPAWPVKEFCKFLSKPYKDKELLQHLAQGVKLYFNYTGQTTCINMSEEATGDLGDLGWGYQACTEMVMPICANNTMFPNIDWDFKAYAAQCKATWDIMPRENWISLHYWGRNITSASNIIFSNGLLDPWAGGGVLQSLSPSLMAILIPSGAHHLDLRAHNPLDPPDVLTARDQEKNIMKNWLQ